MLVGQRPPLALPPPAMAVSTSRLGRRLAEDCESGHARQGTVELFRRSFPDASIAYVGCAARAAPHIFHAVLGVSGHRLTHGACAVLWRLTQEILMLKYRNRGTWTLRSLHFQQCISIFLGC